MAGDKRAMIAAAFRTCIRWALDFALPPRCAGCGLIVAYTHSFCPECWKDVEFLGDSGCSTCGIPLEATEAETCGACLARPPRIARTRAAVAYGDLPRGLAIRLKYGRKVAIARTMTARGVNTPGVMMTTSRMMGTFREDERSRREVLALMGY